MPIMKEIEIVSDPSVIKIITEETRSKILRLLRFRDMTISELSSILNKDISTIFRHIKKLEKVGLVEVTGERRIHNIPEKVYGRTIKTIFLAPEAYEKNAFIKRFHEKNAEAIKEALSEIGYSIKNTEFLKEFIAYMDEITLNDIEKLTRDMDWNNLRTLKEILLLLNIDPEKIEELRKNVHSPRT